MSEHEMPSGTGGSYWFLSIFFAAVTMVNVESFIKIVAGLGGIGSTFMAMRYYYFATKKMKQ